MIISDYTLDYVVNFWNYYMDQHLYHTFPHV